MLSKLILLSSVFFQLAFASGHLRLEITASNDCTVRLLAGNVAKNIALKLGQEHTVVFHPLRDEHLLNLRIQLDGFDTQMEDFEMTESQMKAKSFVFGELVILVRSIFKCNRGFYGENCTYSANITSTSTMLPSTTVANSTASTITTVTSTTTTTVSPKTEKMITKSSSFPLLIILSVLIFLLLAIIVSISIRFFRNRDQKRVYIQPDCGTPEEKKKDVEMVESPESPRYTAAPHTTLLMTPC